MHWRSSSPSCVPRRLPPRSVSIERGTPFARRDFSRADYARLFPRSRCRPPAATFARESTPALCFDEETRRRRATGSGGSDDRFGAPSASAPAAAVHQANRAPFERPLKNLTAADRRKKTLARMEPIPHSGDATVFRRGATATRHLRVARHPPERPLVCMLARLRTLEGRAA